MQRERPVERKVGGRDEFALLGRVPHDLSEEMLNKTMHSRSLKKSYQVRDVIDKPIGRVTYFLNRTLVEEMTRGNISEIEGSVYFILLTIVLFFFFNYNTDVHVDLVWTVRKLIELGGRCT